MNAAVTDTHAIIWYFSGNKRLPRKGRAFFEQAQIGQKQIVVPSIVLVETIFLMQRARVDEAIIQTLLSLPESPQNSIYIYPLNKAVVFALSHFGPAAIPELADRVVAATAYYLNLPVLTADSDMQESNLIQTVW